MIHLPDKRLRRRSVIGVCVLGLVAASVIGEVGERRLVRRWLVPGQWRLVHETVAADSKDAFRAGIKALRGRNAFDAAAVSKMFFWGNLTMVPAGTLVAAAGKDDSGAIKVRLLEGSHSGRILWLYPYSARQLGFLPASPAGEASGK